MTDFTDTENIGVINRSSIEEGEAKYLDESKSILYAYGETIKLTGAGNTTSTIISDGDNSSMLTYNGTRRTAVKLNSIDTFKAITITFKNNGVEKVYVFSADGQLNSDKTNITLSGGHGDFNLRTSTISGYDSVASIYAGNVTNGAIITANTTVPSYIYAENKSVTMVGSSSNDTFRGGVNNVSLVGSSGSNTFILAGSNDTIADYTISDQILSNVYDMTTLRNVTRTSNGLLLTFSKNMLTRTLTLQDILSNATINVNGEEYKFDLDYQWVLSTDGTKVTVLSADAFVDVSSENYRDKTSIFLANGGTITASNNPITIGGYNASLVAGSNHDAFVYGGGDVTISGYGKGGNDKINLPNFYAVVNSTWDSENGCPVLTMINPDSSSAGKIYLMDTNSNITSVRISPANGADDYIDLADSTTDTTGDLFNNASLPSQSTSVIVRSNFGDFGVIGTSSLGTATSGSEYYANMYTVEASRQNSLLIGNQKSNRITARGGTKNLLIGGLGADTFVFENGGGVIRDFGIAAANLGNGKALARDTSQAENTSYSGYNRKDPTSYLQGSDVLQVYGTVVEIAFKGHGDTTTSYFDSSKGVFTAYVTYVSDYDGITYTIALDNILKKPTKTNVTNTAKRVYNTDDVSAASMRIFDTHTGEMAQITE